MDIDNHVATAKPRLDQLDSLRGIAAVMVVLYHVRISNVIIDYAVVRNSFLFVDFFFVLSGFIMYYNYSRLAGPAGLIRFIGLRFFRIYPLHLLMFIAFVVYDVSVWSVNAAGLPHPPASPLEKGRLDFVLNLAMLNGLGIRFPRFNVPSWSISAEFWTYFIFGLTIVCCNGLRRRTVAVVFAALSVSALTLLLLLAKPPSLDQFYRLALLRCVYSFFLGAGLCAVLPDHERSQVTRRVRWDILLQILAVVAVVGLLSVAGSSALDFPLPLLFAAVIAAFTYWPDTPLVRFTRSRLMLWLGKLSYSIYMVHFLLWAVMATFVTSVLHSPFPDNRFTAGIGGGLLFLSLTVGLVLAVASLTYRCVEDPGRRYGRRLLQSLEKPSSKVKIVGVGGPTSTIDREMVGTLGVIPGNHPRIE